MTDLIDKPPGSGPWGCEMRAIMTQQSVRDTRLILAFALGVLILSGTAFWLRVGDLVEGGTVPASPPALAPREHPS